MIFALCIAHYAFAFQCEAYPSLTLAQCHERERAEHLWDQSVTTKCEHVRLNHDSAYRFALTCDLNNDAKDCARFRRAFLGVKR